MSPAADGLRRLIRPPADINTEDVAEEFGGIAPLVVLELPALAGGKDGNDAAPVLRLKLFGTLDQDESHRSVRVDVLEHAVNV